MLFTALAQYAGARKQSCELVQKQELNRHCPAPPPTPPPSPPSPIKKKIFGLKLIGVLFTVLHAQVLDQTILRSTQQQQSLPHATTILLIERGTTLTI